MHKPDDVRIVEVRKALKKGGYSIQAVYSDPRVGGRRYKIVLWANIITDALKIVRKIVPEAIEYYDKYRATIVWRYNH